jgi:gliding motility-associated-like protein
VANGGTPPYSYTFNGSTNSTGLFSGVSAGLNKPYSITDASNCGPVTGTVNVTQPLVLALTSAAVTSPILCNGGTGTVSIVANGGTPPYSYTFNGATNSTGLFTGVSSGLNKPYRITDASNCGPLIGTINVTQPQVLALTSAAITSPILCNGGGATVTNVANGGTPPYKYTFDGRTNNTGVFNGVLTGLNKPYSITDASNCGPVTGNLSITGPAMLVVLTTQTDVKCFGNSSASATALVQGGSAPYSYSWNTIPVQTTATASNLSAGNYIVTVTDNTGCITIANVSILQPSALLVVSTTNTDVQCFGGSASATAIAQGGTPPYSYSWNTIPVQTTATASNLSGGNYIVTVIDNDGCMATANVSILESSALLNVSITKTDVQCFGGSSSATAIVQGGTAPYTYSWNTIPVQTTATANNLSAGNYMVTVTDNSGCIGTANVIINQPAEALVVNTMKTDVLCFGDATGSATANVQGGTAPYSYSWNTIPVQSTATINNLKAGTYMVTVTDNSGCIATANVIINQPLQGLMVNPIQTDVLCFGESTGSATAIPTGGTPPYTYLWNTIPAQTTATVNNLPAGNYTVRVTDSNGCIATANVSITQPEPITGSAMAAIILTGQGGTGPLIYTLNGVSNGTGIFTNIESGVEYNWSITDANNCQVASGITGLCLNPLALIVIDKVNVLCFNGNTGSIKVEASGGDAPYEYKLNNSPYQASGTFNTLTAGAYTVTVRDAKGKTSSVPVTITQPTLLTVSTIKTDILCEGEATGTASALAQGGTAPYSYSWNTLPVKTTVTANGLTAGTYSVRVTDANGCTATAPVTIVALNSLPTAAFTSSQSGLNTWTFVNTSVNATSYAWDFGDGQASTIANPIHVYEAPGTYTVKLTVANSCGTDIETLVLTVPELEFFNGFSPNGDGQNDNWNIPVLNYYPVNTVLIVNRWGSEIWKGTNYNNKDVVWTGKNMNGEDMPDGTYYYIINYDNTEKRGWVFIKR